MLLHELITLLPTQHSLLYLILFLGAFFETLIGTSFVIYGELFFLAGSILAGLGQAQIVLVALVLYTGSFLGDHCSYWIGRLWGDTLFLYLREKVFFRIFFTANNYEKGTQFFMKYGGWAVFFGRFLGPVSWITPFLAGVFKLSYLKFTIFDIPGVILGVGQFILIGYMFGSNYEIILSFFQRYLLLSIFTAGVVMLCIRYYKKRHRKKHCTSTPS